VILNHQIKSSNQIFQYLAFLRRIVFSWSVGKEINGRQPTSENSIFSKLHSWITFQAGFKNKPITYEAILEHVWITFQARFKHEHAVLHQFQNSCANHNIKKFWTMFRSHFEHISRTRFEYCSSVGALSSRVEYFAW
jgi:hypothetical protein